MIGIGLRHPHVAALLQGARVDLDFVEVHAENLMDCGGPGPARLERVCERHALSVHGVGLSLGGETPPDADHLRALRALLARFQPRWFSEHLAWSRHDGRCFNDLLPLPYRGDTLQRVCAHVDAVQTALGRRLLLENPSSYLAFRSSTWHEADFLAEVVRRTGCGLLLDINNVHVSCSNLGGDALDYLARLPMGAVEEIHLAGFAVEAAREGLPRLLIDTHGAPVDEAVWQLHAAALRRFGPVPTLIERDQNLPPLATLLAEAHRARDAMLSCAAQRLVEAA